MGKKKSKTMSSVFQEMMQLCTVNTSYDPSEPNGFRIRHKKRVRRACIHTILRNGDKMGEVPDPKVSIETDEVAGTAHCLVCDRTFPIPDISMDGLQILKQAIGVVNSALVMLPWAKVGKSDATLAIDCRNLLENFAILYESSLREISTAHATDTDISIKSHVSRL